MTININIVQETKNLEEYFYATYEVESTVSVYDAAWNIAVGQSIGNPTKRSVWETTEMIAKYCAKILRKDNFEATRGIVEIGYPIANIDWKQDGISQLLCIVQGGQTDIATITKCRALKLEFSPDFVARTFNKPKFGISGFRDFTNTHGKPFFGGIVKPKTGISPSQLLDMTREMVEGGVNFIKEDEVMANPDVCPLEVRVPLIAEYMRDKPVVYCFCINSDPAYILDRARFVAANGGNGVHINIWSGLGAVKSVRDLDLPLYIHYQKSGDKVITHPANPFGISWHLLCQLAAFAGVDTIHAGMWGGYLSDSEEDLRDVFEVLHGNNVVPALSCGMEPSLVQPIVDKFGIDWMANVGGYIHSDPLGTREGSKKMRAACDAILNLEK